MANKEHKTNKVTRLAFQLEIFADRIQVHGDLKVLRQIDESFYRQKAVELKFMLIQIQELEERLELLNSRLIERYQLAYSSWRKDVLWLNRKMLNELSSKMSS